MRGHYLSRRWAHDPTLYAPPRYRRACAYEAFVPEAVAGFNDPVPADIDQLVDAGILLPTSASKRNRSWEADGLLDLLAGLEAASDHAPGGRSA